MLIFYQQIFLHFAQAWTQVWIDNGDDDQYYYDEQIYLQFEFDEPHRFIQVGIWGNFFD